MQQENSERVDAFRAEIDSMKVRASGAQSERRILALGVVAIVVGLTLTIIGGVQVTNTVDPADQRAFMATGTFLGIAFLIAGAAFFVRYSLSRYMRFWLIRLIHESRANTDRLIEALEGRGAPVNSDTSVTAPPQATIPPPPPVTGITAPPPGSGPVS